jgi:hypothetical protein
MLADKKMINVNLEEEVLREVIIYSLKDSFKNSSNEKYSKAIIKALKVIYKTLNIVDKVPKGYSFMRLTDIKNQTRFIKVA